MRHDRRMLVASCAVLVALAPAARAQSINALLKAFQQHVPSDLVDTIKSFNEIAQGQLAAGDSAPDADGKVVLYRTAWCGYCKRAAAYMRQKSIPFVERDIEANPSFKAEYTRLGGKGGVPFMVFGEKTMSGFSEGPFDRTYAEFKRTLSATVPGAASVGHGPEGGASAVGSGDTLIGKIPGVPVYAHATKSSERITALAKTDEAVFMGEERDGLYRVTTSKGEGWIDKLLVRKP